MVALSLVLGEVVGLVGVDFPLQPLRKNESDVLLGLVSAVILVDTFPG